MARVPVPVEVGVWDGLKVHCCGASPPWKRACNTKGTDGPVDDRPTPGAHAQHLGVPLPRTKDANTIQRQRRHIHVRISWAVDESSNTMSTADEECQLL